MNVPVSIKVGAKKVPYIICHWGFVLFFCEAHEKHNPQNRTIYISVVMAVKFHCKSGEI